MGTKVQSLHNRFVKMTPTEFFHLVHQLPDAQVIASKAGCYRYLTRYEGFTFHTQSEQPLTFITDVRPLSTTLPTYKGKHELQSPMA
jgi:hypothetical protein